MQQLPDICISICGAVVLVSLALLPGLVRMVRRAPEYVTVQDVPNGNEEWL